jgi:VIT1/CCC1 family predicted Fe2+/Mn2+ transporter
MPLVRGQLPQQTSLKRDDFVGAIAVLCCALGASIPAVLPLALIDDPWVALRLSNLLVVGLLFVFGYH